MEQIINHNCAGLCSEMYCNQIEEEFLQVNLYGMIFLIGFCKKHAIQFDEKITNEVKRRMEEDDERHNRRTIQEEQHG